MFVPEVLMCAKAIEECHWSNLTLKEKIKPNPCDWHSAERRHDIGRSGGNDGKAPD